MMAERVVTSVLTNQMINTPTLMQNGTIKLRPTLLPYQRLDNFRFLFSSRDAFIITRNTVLYNLGFIFLGLVVSVGIAIILSELRSKRMVKIFQTSMLFPYFLSWVIISFFTDAFLNIDKGRTAQPTMKQRQWTEPANGNEFAM